MTAAASPDETDPAPSSKGPDFLCVGLQKAGTQWLYDQLDRHPDFWMPPFKELHYFDREFPTGKIEAAARRATTEPERYARSRRRASLRPLEPRDARFFGKVTACSGRPHDFETYADLFAEKNGQISGDVTPGYSTLDDSVVAAIGQRFPDARVVLMLRDPVERAWSAWRMHLRNFDKPAATEQDPKAFARHLDKAAALARSYPSRIAPRWAKAFGGRFRVFFLDDVAARPEATRDDILTFLGADPAKATAIAADFNRKQREGAFRSAAIQKVTRERFEAERRACAEMFGGAALDWPASPY